MKPTEAIDTGYTPQPAPIKRTTTPIHDLVIIDLITYTTGNHLLAKEIDDRKKVGLAEYGTPLQAFNGRDCEKDCIEEMADAICYLKQGILEGKTYLELIYHRQIALAVDTINLRAINAPYYDVTVKNKIDGSVEYYRTKALSAHEASRIVLGSLPIELRESVEVIDVDQILTI